MNFDRAADELHRKELARLAAAVTPRIEAFCSMTAGAFRDAVAEMMERLEHTLITVTPWLVTVKEERKFVTACANPIDPTPIKMPAIRRLHDEVTAASAFKGIYVTPRSFTPDAQHYAKQAPIQLVDGELLIKSMQLSRKGVLLPQTYKAMCRQSDCGEIVHHQLDRQEARPCGNGHLMAPTISRAMLISYRPPAPRPGQKPAGPAPTNALAMHPAPHPGGFGTMVKALNASPKAKRKRAIKVHNRRRRARAIKEQRADSRD